MSTKDAKGLRLVGAGDQVEKGLGMRSSTAIDLRGSGFSSQQELEDWFAFCDWARDPDADPSLYDFKPGRGWFRVVRVEAAALLPFIAALADLLLTDLLRVGPGKG